MSGNPGREGLKGSELSIAIIGAGVTGLSLAVGLASRGVHVTVYERASRSRDISAGIGFTPNAERAMKALDDRIYRHFRQIAVQNGDDWFRYVNGLSRGGGNPEELDQDVIFKIYLGERGFEGCRRTDFNAGLIEFLPPGTIKYGKTLTAIEDGSHDCKVTLQFEDGSSAEANGVIGCDGIRSRVRKCMFGDKFPATYTHKVAFRGLVPMKAAENSLGLEKTKTRIMYLGPDAHTLTFPVADGNLLNVVSFITDPHSWDIGLDDEAFVKPAEKCEVVKAFSSFNDDVRNITSLFPESMVKWAIYDMFENPIPYYSTDKVCLAGDAAHAAAPHHGAGAGSGIEDALVLAELLARWKDPQKKTNESSRFITEAFKAYNDVRYERSQWVVKSSREVGEMYEWQDPRVGRDRDIFGQDFGWRCRTIWDYNTDEMVASAVNLLSK